MSARGDAPAREPLKVSIILPTYDERDNIGPLIDGIVQHVGDDLHEIIVIDDDSPDRTWEEVQEKQAAIPRLTLTRRTDERGLYSAIRRGVEQATGDVIGWMDCDLSMPPQSIPDLVDAVRAGAEIAVGSRFVPGGADARDVRFHKALSWIICHLTALTLDASFKDYTSGFILMRRHTLSALPPDGDYGEYFIALIYRAKRQGFKVVEVPYTLVPRTSGESKTATNLFGFARRGRKYLATVARLRLGG